MKTQKAKDLLIHGGFSYIFESNGANGKKIWRCSKWTSIKCKGRCHSIESQIIWQSDNHNHLPDPISIEVIEVKNELIGKAKLSNETTKSILATTCSNLTLPISARLPRVESMKRMIQRNRNPHRILTPTSLEELKIPEDFKFTFKNENFLIYD